MYIFHLKIGANTGSKFKAEKRAYIFRIVLFKCIYRMPIKTYSLTYLLLFFGMITITLNTPYYYYHVQSDQSFLDF